MFDKISDQEAAERRKRLQQARDAEDVKAGRVKKPRGPGRISDAEFKRRNPWYARSLAPVVLVLVAAFAGMAGLVVIAAVVVHYLATIATTLQAMYTEGLADRTTKAVQDLTAAVKGDEPA